MNDIHLYIDAFPNGVMTLETEKALKKMLSLFQGSSLRITWLYQSQRLSFITILRLILAERRLCKGRGITINNTIRSYVIYYLTFRENKSLYRTIKVSEEQELISTGIYGIIRHPMYLASSLFYAGLIAVLNSGIAAITILAMFPLLYQRVKHEEAFLSQNLLGYTEYMQKVQYRIIPYVW